MVPYNKYIIFGDKALKDKKFQRNCSHLVQDSEMHETYHIKNISWANADDHYNTRKTNYYELVGVI